ncbi:hypothetical protein CHS0354_030190 [Potamilus streckersoni]|uniref:tRNA (guanine-N(7)-)-methyltransferase non-catalytic subunit n=1 Tax=Potamilus streckersoni TaxID=2493646 RepID=A0AAE0ST57_9BIVA|nr:hypothetical protein CHS0354_030190 [Potamilus streckersoni]
MAAIRITGKKIIITSGIRFLVFDDGKKIGCFELEGDVVQEVNKKDCDDKQDNKQRDDTQNGGTNYILATALSPSGEIFAICDNRKQLHLFQTRPKWQLLSRRTAPKRCTAVIFAQQEMEVLAADKAGDVYKYSVTDPLQEPQMVLGHLSILLDLALTPDDKFIVTCDRDEKVRISHYPNAYNIHAFCLGHTDFVSQIMYLNKSDCLLSGSGDGTIRSWDLNGQEKGCVRCQRSPGDGEDGETTSSNMAVKSIEYCSLHDIVAVIFYKLNVLHLYHLSEDTLNMEFLTEAIVTEEPWDICFDEKGRLWVLQPSKEQTLLVYQCWQDESYSFQITQCTDEDIVSILKEVNSNWEFFEVSTSVPSLYTGLQKLKVDNMTEYLAKKQERISGKNRGTTEPPEKKLKI